MWILQHGQALPLTTNAHLAARLTHPARLSAGLSPPSSADLAGPHNAWFGAVHADSGETVAPLQIRRISHVKRHAVQITARDGGNCGSSPPDRRIGVLCAARPPCPGGGGGPAISG